MYACITGKENNRRKSMQLAHPVYRGWIRAVRTSLGESYDSNLNFSADFYRWKTDGCCFKSFLRVILARIAFSTFSSRITCHVQGRMQGGVSGVTPTPKGEKRKICAISGGKILPTVLLPRTLLYTYVCVHIKRYHVVGLELRPGGQTR